MRRKAFFSFHYADVLRVNNVRNIFKFYKLPESVAPTFYDASLWESRKLDGDDALKRLIREGVNNTSVVCVLIGSETYARRWVRYEIARSVIDQKGLLAVDINSLNHHRDRVPHPHGENPLSYMGVGTMRDGTYRLFERKAMWNGAAYVWQWLRYDDHMAAVPLPRYLTAAPADYVAILHQGALRHDFVGHQGAKNIGGWLDLAATRAGR